MGNVTSASCPSGYISPGKAAGIGIGCAFAGAAITLAVLFLMKNCRRRPSFRPKPTTPLRSVVQSSNVLDDLPQDIAHQELNREFSQLETQIKNFVTNFFHTHSVHVEAIDDEKLFALLSAEGVQSHPSNAHWPNQLRDMSTRNIMLKSYISKVLLSRINPRGVAEDSFLPVDVVRCYQALLVGNTQNRSPRLLEYWRSITAFLISKQYPSNMIAQQDLRLDNINRMVSDLLDALQPFRNGKPEKRAKEVLETIVTSTAVFGLKLFSEINPVEVEWPSSRGQVVIFPALRQLRLDGGRKVTIKHALMD
ncbi:hypothetical protein F4805DRAFT_144659 [Annulohypoxylon moriforme]|nr:hypothetical protein F4805DRAFT_144659 [Annulohypoxylon moriforme]